MAVVKPGENTEREAAGIGHECGKFPSFGQPRNGLPKLREVIDYRPAHIVMCIKVSVRVVALQVVVVCGAIIPGIGHFISDMTQRVGKLPGQSVPRGSAHRKLH